MLERRRLGVEADADHVEADVTLCKSSRRQEVASDARDAHLLARVHRLERRSRPIAAPAPDLDEDQRRPVEGDQVDLTGPAAEVALHDGQSLGLEQLRRERFAAPAKLPPPIHGRREYSAAGSLARRARLRAAGVAAYRPLR